MLNILKKKSKNIFNDTLKTYYIKKDSKIQTNLWKKEYKKIIYYPSSAKEWTNDIYSFNKSYVKLLIIYYLLVNNLFKNYFNMYKDKIKILFKRRRSNKIRYSANKIYVSRAEVNHTNKKLIIFLYTYNKTKSLIEKYMTKIIHLKKKTYRKKIIYKNRLLCGLKKGVLYSKKFKIVFFKITDNILNYIAYIERRSRRLVEMYLYEKNGTMQQHITYLYTYWEKRLWTKRWKLRQEFTDNTTFINFNLSKFSNLLMIFNDLGLTTLIKKLYNKYVEINIVELRSIHLNSDVFSSAVMLKLRDRKNKAVRILRKAILKMVKIPDLHTIITFYYSMQSITKNTILNVLKQQVVSGVRFEASGRLTRRLTAERAISKNRYMGSLKEMNSSYNNESSTILRGYVKSNSQYTIIESKTRNGAFGLKTWISSHFMILDIFNKGLNMESLDIFFLIFFNLIYLSRYTIYYLQMGNFYLLHYLSFYLSIHFMIPRINFILYNLWFDLSILFAKGWSTIKVYYLEHKSTILSSAGVLCVTYSFLVLNIHYVYILCSVGVFLNLFAFQKITFPKLIFGFVYVFCSGSLLTIFNKDLPYLFYILADFPQLLQFFEYRFVMLKKLYKKDKLAFIINLIILLIAIWDIRIFTVHSCYILNEAFGLVILDTVIDIYSVTLFKLVYCEFLGEWIHKCTHKFIEFFVLRLFETIHIYMGGDSSGFYVEFNGDYLYCTGDQTPSPDTGKGGEGAGDHNNNGSPEPEGNDSPKFYEGKGKGKATESDMKRMYPEDYDDLNKSDGESSERNAQINRDGEFAKQLQKKFDAEAHGQGNPMEDESYYKIIAQNIESERSKHAEAFNKIAIKGNPTSEEQAQQAFHQQESRKLGAELKALNELELSHFGRNLPQFERPERSGSEDWGSGKSGSEDWGSENSGSENSGSENDRPCKRPRISEAGLSNGGKTS